MKAKRILHALFLFGILLSLSAQDFAGGGYNVISRGSEGGNIAYRLTDRSGLPFTLVVRSEPTARQLQTLDSILDVFRSMRYVNIASLRVVYANERAEIILVPRSFVYREMDLAPYMPSGMQFYYSDYMEYDFRMTSRNLFFRIRGQYFAEDLFADRLAAAVDDPFAYIQSNDPDFVFRKFLSLEERLDKYAALGNKARDDLAAEIADLRTDLKSDIQGLSAYVEALSEKHGSLGENTALLESEFILLRQAVLVLHNRGFFGSINLPSEEGIDKLVAMKQREPELTIMEAQDRLEAEGIKMTRREVFLVFSVYFNEFE